MSRAPSNKMKDMYAAKRKESIKKVQEAIDYIQDCGRIVTKKELMELTGLSSGTFSQDYIKNVLKENKVCQFKDVKKTEIIKKKEQLEKQSIAKLETENKQLISKMQDFEIVLDMKEQTIKKLKEENEKLNLDNINLRGKYQQALELLDVYGANLDSLGII